jgi:hypothetical protein
MVEVIVVTGSANAAPVCLSTRHDLRPDHQVPVCRSDNAVLEFNEINGRVHAAGNGNLT